MDTIQILRLVVNERLTTAAKEICGVVERTISDYEEELSLFKQEVDRQRRLFNAVLQPQVVLNVNEIPQFTTFEVKQEETCDGPAAWKTSLGSTDDLPNSGCEMDEDDPPKLQECQQQLSPSQDHSGCEMDEDEMDEDDPPKLQECQQQLSPSQDQGEPACKTPEQPALQDGCMASETRATNIDDSLVEGEQNKKKKKKYRRLYKLRIGILMDPTIETFSLYHGSYRVKSLNVPFGLTEEEFLTFLRTTFPQLADTPFDILRVDRNRQFWPLNIEKLTPEHIIRSRCLGRSALYIRVKKTDKPMDEEETYEERGLFRPEKKQTDKPMVEGAQEKTHAVPFKYSLRTCFLPDPTMITLSRVPKECQVQVLKVPRRLSEEQFKGFLRTTFPQLADGPFDVLRTNSQRRLCPLKVDNLTPEQIIKSGCLGRSALYIRLRAEDQCQTSQYWVQHQSRRARRRAKNKGGDPVPSASRDEEVKMVPIRGDCGKPEPPSEPFPSHCSGAKQLQEDCDEHRKKSWNPTEKRLDNDKSVELPSASLQAEGALRHKGEDGGESEAVRECRVSLDRCGANGDDGSVCVDDRDIDADNDDTNDNDADDDDWKMSGGSDGTSDCDGEESEAKSKRKTRKNDRGRRRRSTNPPLFCKVCEAIFYSQVALINHAQTHADDGATMEFPCGVCGQSSLSLEGLMDHLQSHTGDRPYQCDVCDKRFTVADSLKRHAVIHTGNRPYQCNVCHKGFAFAATLRRHAVIHTRETPYPCTFYGKCFRDSTSLRSHIVSVYKNKKHACTECGKRFKFRHHLKGHMMVHSEERGETSASCVSIDFVTTRDAIQVKNRMPVHTAQKHLV